MMDRDGVGVQSSPQTVTVTVTGTGWAEAAPDLMTVSIGVESRAGTVGAAYSAAGAALASVTAVFRGHGVASADLRTAGLSVRADLVWREGEGQQVAGYVAASTLTVRLRDLTAAPDILSRAAAAAGDDVRLHSVVLTVSDEAALKERARAAAWENATAAAAQFATLASGTLGRVLSVAEHGPAQQPVPLAGLQRAAAVETVAIEPGESRVEAGVTVVWELLPR